MDRNFCSKEIEWRLKWEQLGQHICQFPEWMQTILLEDLNTAIRNRIAVFEMIHSKVKGVK